MTSQAGYQHGPDGKSPLPTDGTPVRRNKDATASIKSALKSLALSGIAVKNDLALDDVLFSIAERPLADQLLHLVARGPMQGITIYRRSDRFDPHAITKSLERYGLTRAQISRFMHSVYQTPAH